MLVETTACQSWHVFLRRSVQLQAGMPQLQPMTVQCHTAVIC